MCHPRQSSSGIHLLPTLPLLCKEGLGEVESPFQLSRHPSSFSFIRLSWPGGMAEPCNRHRRKGEHCLSPSRKLRAGSASLHAAGGGEPRRAPEGPCHGQYGFGHCCRNKSGPAAGTRPGTTTPSLTPPTNLHQQKFYTVFNGLGSMAAGSLINQIRTSSRQNKPLGQCKNINRKFRQIE